MRRRLAAALVALVVACGGTTAPLVESAPPPAGPVVDAGPDVARGDGAAAGLLDLRFDDGFVRKGQRTPDAGFVLVLERPVDLRTRMGHPDRRLVLVDASGRTRGAVDPAAGRELLDVVVHPSGEATALEASDAGYHLVRLDAAGARLREVLLVDDAVLTDPPALAPGELTSRIETHTHDTGRVDADGEEVLLATRTGRHSVVAYRLDATFAIVTRTLVIPAHPIYPVGLRGGTYDAFGQLDAHYGVHVVRDGRGLVHVSVQHARVDTEDVVRVIQKVFGETLEGDPDGRDAFVTRIDRAGKRLGIVAAGTLDEDQLYGVHADDDGVWLAGRSERWNAEGTGWDALVLHVDGRGFVEQKRLDVDRGDVAFDVTPLGGGLLLVSGAQGYWQNPSGASISEEAASLGRVVEVPSGNPSVARTLPLPSGPRHSQARFALALPDGKLAVGGMLDGPGTHSADGDAKLLRARGFFVTRPRP